MNNPFLFVLGCQRSGTTLLQHILDSHPDIAIMQEAGWFGTWYEHQIGISPEGFATVDLIPNILRTSKNIDLCVDEADLLKLAGNGRPIRYQDFISAVFDRFGAARKKHLVGSKNPDYLRHLPTLHTLWPRAKYVHIIRDGRDVCLCASDRWKNSAVPQFPFLLYEKPDRVFDRWMEDPVITTALWWEWNVGLGRDFGRSLGPEMYYELRYEDLVTRPRDVCIELCDFLEIAFSDAMLRHQENFRPRKGPRGAILHARVGLPITSGLRDWRIEMPAEDLGRFEAAAGGFLEELSYPRGAAQARADHLAEANRIRGLFEEVAATALRS